VPALSNNSFAAEMSWLGLHRISYSGAVPFRVIFKIAQWKMAFSTETRKQLISARTVSFNLTAEAEGII
jgi:hypothetical protein